MLPLTSPVALRGPPGSAGCPPPFIGGASAAARRIPIETEPTAFDLRWFEMMLPAVLDEDDPAVAVQPRELAPEHALAVDRFPDLHLRLLAGEPLIVGNVVESSVEARRADL